METPVLTLEETASRLEAVADQILSLGVARLAVFGSVLRGNAQASSDIDFLVQFRPGLKSYEGFMVLSELLEQRLGRPVELVTTEALSPYLGPRILAEARDVVRAA
jgi:predicted nucleotidyltransferase